MKWCDDLLKSFLVRNFGKNISKCKNEEFWQEFAKGKKSFCVYMGNARRKGVEGKFGLKYWIRCKKVSLIKEDVGTKQTEKRNL